MSLVDDAAALLRAGPLADLGPLLKPGGRREVEREIARIAAGGLRAHVVVAPLDAALEPLQALWEQLAFSSQADLLLLFNGKSWEARGWELSPAAIDAALDRARPGLRAYYGRGLALALAELEKATGRRQEPSETGSEPAPLARSFSGAGVAVVGLAAVAGLAWVVVRRQRRARERRRTLAEARADADKIFADVLLAAEEMSGPEAAALREKASRLHDQLDALAPPGQKQLPPREESLTLARLLQTENELEALRSRVLQAKRRS
ncbi:MAG TPA: hypothetical protein VKZ18_20265 [Polyangia bacterium]|nr:hypothetical protein [Polyangia bacterium]